MNCTESFGDIKSIKAYAYDQVKLPFLFTNNNFISKTAVSISGQPAAVDVDPESISLTSSDENSSSGKSHNHALSWTYDKVTDDVLAQISALTSGFYHFVCETYDGDTYLVYNWNKSGKVNYNSSNTKDGDSKTLSFNCRSLMPVLKLV